MTRYHDDYPQPRPRGNLLNTIAGMLTIAGTALVLIVGWPLLRDMLLNQRPLALPQAAPTARIIAPTLTDRQRLEAQQDAPATDAEQQVIQQPAPATPMPHADAPAQPGTSFSPIDLGNAPLPTPTSGLSQEQLDASQASEEVNQLNTMQSGLTEAQKLVQQHDAEWSAAHP